MNITKKIMVLCAGFLFTLSCDRDDLSLVNPNEVVVDTYYKNADELRAGVFAIYASIQSANLYSREYWFLHDLRSDENKAGGGQLETPRNQLLIGSNDPGNAVANSVWNGWYQTILRANIVITQGATVPDIEEGVRTALIAEAKLIRGWAYFELGSIWGGAPIYTTYAETINESAPKSTQEEVLNQAVQDLQDAAAGLPTVSEVAQPGRFSKGSALAMLGRTQMFRGDYTSAKAAFDKIVQSGNYELVAEYDDNFQEENEYNKESLMEIGYAPLGEFNWDGTGDGIGNEKSVRTQEYSAVGWRNLIPSEALLNAFERVSKGDTKNDPRFGKSFYMIGDTFNNGEEVLKAENVQGEATTFEGVSTKISWRKYSIMYKINPGGSMNSGINMRVIRYAEVLLNLAECELETGNPSKAIQLLNQVRNRPSVDMPEYPTANFPVGSTDQIMAAIIHEKRVELSSEQIRNRDILRWRKEGKFKSEPLPYFTPKMELLPIPQSEIDNNAQMSEADQNTGY